MKASYRVVTTTKSKSASCRRGKPSPQEGERRKTGILGHFQKIGNPQKIMQRNARKILYKDDLFAFRCY